MGATRPVEGHSIMIVSCDKCGSSWNSPAVFQHNARHELGFLFRSDRATGGIAELRILTKVSLRDAKTIYEHVSKTRSKCHQCSGPLDGNCFTCCRRCDSFNYDL